MCWRCGWCVYRVEQQCTSHDKVGQDGLEWGAEGDGDDSRHSNGLRVHCGAQGGLLGRPYLVWCDWQITCHRQSPPPLAPSPSRLYQVGKRQAAGYALFVATGHIACYASKVRRKRNRVQRSQTFWGHCRHA